jgi:predicted P-loop ATPase
MNLHTKPKVNGHSNVAELSAHRERAVLDAFEGLENVMFWPERKRDGEPKVRSQRNIEAFLERAGAELSYNEFSHKALFTRGEKTAALTDDIGTDLWLEADRLGLQCQKKFFLDVLMCLARKNGFHPVRQYLDGLKWDGVPRLDRWLTEYLGVKDTELARAYGRKHMIASVRRVREPGVKHDSILVLSGEQGRGKSSAICTLCPDEEMFTDSLSAGDDQKVVIEIASGKWLVELSELDSMTKRDAGTVKAMLSRRQDTSRLAWGILTTERPRQFTMWGTVNKPEYLTDDTGNRRFWGVQIGSHYDPDEAIVRIKEDRDQLWAEAAHYESIGESLTLPKHLWGKAADQQKGCLVSDPWQDVLESVFAGRTHFIMQDDVWAALGVDTKTRNAAMSQRINGIMKSLGWVKRQRRVAGKSPRVFVHITEADDAA